MRSTPERECPFPHVTQLFANLKFLSIEFEGAFEPALSDDKLVQRAVPHRMVSQLSSVFFDPCTT